MYVHIYYWRVFGLAVLYAGRLASYTQQLHSITYLSITALTLTLPLHKSAECTRLLFLIPGMPTCTVHGGIATRM